MGSIRLPAHLARAIRQVAAELRRLPRDAVTDRRELVHWLAAHARALEAVAGSRLLEAPAPEPAPVAPAAAAPPCPVCEARRRKGKRRRPISAEQLPLPFADDTP